LIQVEHLQIIFSSPLYQNAVAHCISSSFFYWRPIIECIIVLISGVTQGLSRSAKGETIPFHLKSHYLKSIYGRSLRLSVYINESTQNFILLLNSTCIEVR